MHLITAADSGNDAIFDEKGCVIDYFERSKQLPCQENCRQISTSGVVRRRVRNGHSRRLSDNTSVVGRGKLPNVPPALTLVYWGLARSREAHACEWGAQPVR